MAPRLLVESVFNVIRDWLPSRYLDSASYTVRLMMGWRAGIRRSARLHLSRVSQDCVVLNSDDSAGEHGLGHSLFRASRQRCTVNGASFFACYQPCRSSTTSISCLLKLVQFFSKSDYLSARLDAIQACSKGQRGCRAPWPSNRPVRNRPHVWSAGAARSSVIGCPTRQSVDAAST